jgi:hypothetical protein
MNERFWTFDGVLDSNHMRDVLRSLDSSGSAPKEGIAQCLVSFR